MAMQKTPRLAVLLLEKQEQQQQQKNNNNKKNPVRHIIKFSFYSLQASSH